MGRTALYRDPVQASSARADVQLDADVIVLRMPDGRVRRLSLDGTSPFAIDGFVVFHVDIGSERRFVRMLVLEGDTIDVLITPPEYGALAPNVVRVPEAPAEAAVIDPAAWEAL